MSKIKFDMEDFCWGGELWTVIDKYAGNERLGMDVDEAVQRLIKKYVKRERKRLARSTPPIWMGKSELIEILKQERTKPMNWPADFPGKH